MDQRVASPGQHQQLSWSYLDFEREFQTSSAFMQLRMSSDWSLVSCRFSGCTNRATLAVTIASAPSLRYEWELVRAPVASVASPEEVRRRHVHGRGPGPGVRLGAESERGVPTAWTVSSIRATAGR